MTDQPPQHPDDQAPQVDYIQCVVPKIGGVVQANPTPVTYSVGKTPDDAWVTVVLATVTGVQRLFLDPDSARDLAARLNAQVSPLAIPQLDLRNLNLRPPTGG